MSNHIASYVQELDETLRNEFIVHHGVIIEHLIGEQYKVFGKVLEGLELAKNAIDEARSNKGWLAKSIIS